jgi:transcription factor STE12
VVEVEVQGELPEEGLLPSVAAGVPGTPHELFPSSAPNVQFVQPGTREQSGYPAVGTSSPWCMQTTPLPSPGFHSPEASPAQATQQINGSSAHYHSYPGHMAGPYAPVSAPPHKSGFDQPPMYAQSLEHSQPSGSGPIRRYRSVTPSVAQNGELIRRPITAASMSDYRAASPAPRGYHPYAGALASGYAPNSSTRSSPAGYHVPLEPTPLHQSQIPRAADESVPGAVNFAAIAAPSMVFGLSNARDSSSYDGLYLAETSPTLPESSYPQTEPFYQAPVQSNYFTGSHGESRQVVM